MYPLTATSSPAAISTTQDLSLPRQKFFVLDQSNGNFKHSHKPEHLFIASPSDIIDNHYHLYHPMDYGRVF